MRVRPTLTVGDCYGPKLSDRVSARPTLAIVDQYEPKLSDEVLFSNRSFENKFVNCGQREAVSLKASPVIANPVVDPSW